MNSSPRALDKWGYQQGSAELWEVATFVTNWQQLNVWPGLIWSPGLAIASFLMSRWPSIGILKGYDSCNAGDPGVLKVVCMDGVYCALSLLMFGDNTFLGSYILRWARCWLSKYTCPRACRTPVVTWKGAKKLAIARLWLRMVLACTYDYCWLGIKVGTGSKSWESML